MGEILYLLTADNHLDGDDPFPLPDDNETLDSPLEFPDEEETYSLQALRHKLLAVSISKEEAERWTWRYIEWSLPDPAGQPVPVVRGIRDDIDERVRKLCSQLDE